VVQMWEEEMLAVDVQVRQVVTENKASIVGHCFFFSIINTFGFSYLIWQARYYMYHSSLSLNTVIFNVNANSY